MQDDVIDFNICLYTEGETLVSEASSPLGESYGTSARPHIEELALGGRTLGELLFRRLFPGAVQRLYQRCRGHLTSSGRLRVRIRARGRVNAMELMRIHSMPWEFVHDPHGDGFLALDPQIQLVRYLNLPIAVPTPLPVASQGLEVLIAVASPASRSRLAWEEECAAIERAFTDTAVQVTVLPQTTRSALLDHLATQRYDVLHFIGHGSGPTQTRPGLLVLDNKSGDTECITARELALIARATPSLRLVFLNACSTAELAEHCHRTLAGSVGTALALRGVPAVVAMTSAVDDADAIAFAKAVYTRLGEGAALEAAVHAGRIAVRLGNARTDSWTIPVVFSRAAAGQPAAHDEPAAHNEPAAHEPAAHSSDGSSNETTPSSCVTRRT